VTHPEDRLHYSMLVEWDPDDDIYVVTVPELPGCYTHGESYEDAVLHGQEAIESWIAAALANGVPIPPPMTARAGAAS
jgi:predicted RNase H-like HicB family nuclease